MNFNEYLKQFETEVAETVLTEEEREGEGLPAIKDGERVLDVIESEEVKKLFVLANRYAVKVQKHAMQAMLMGDEGLSLWEHLQDMGKIAFYQESFFQLARLAAGATELENFGLREGWMVCEIPPKDDEVDISNLLQAMRRPN